MSFWETRAADDAAARLSAGAAAYAVGAPLEEIVSRTRGSAEAAFARQVAMYLCHVVFEWSLARVAQAFARDRSTVAHACHSIEDRRDDEAFDDWMAALEESVRTGAATRAARR
ncbi:MAG TPA: helix-turn-helix domain-containing protein [Terricaulis sp.]|nr:helix-turn-helix domain-containing protein [Terricaulis sp.]HRP11052.1 helix-turn-helix domain-containing protein [Terricaulis sp.]